MKILMLYTPFFGYEEGMKAELERMGHQVFLRSTRAFKKPIGRAFYKFLPKLLTPINNKYFQGILDELQEESFDILLTNDRIPTFFVQALKARCPQIRCILYMEDSVENLRHIKETFPVYHRIVTFDRQDAQKYGFDFQPLYYRSEYAQNTEGSCAYDISFVGTCHSDRYRVIRQVQQYCREHGYQFYGFCYLQSKFVYYFYKLTKPEYRHAKLSDFRFDKLTAAQTSHIFHSSRCILDIQHPKQSGLTMRTLETIGARKKLITTNGDISSYDFYNTKNICIVDRQNPVLNEEFMAAEYVDMGFDETKYSLNNWLKSVLEIQE